MHTGFFGIYPWSSYAFPTYWNRRSTLILPLFFVAENFTATFSHLLATSMVLFFAIWVFDDSMRRDVSSVAAITLHRRRRLSCRLLLFASPSSHMTSFLCTFDPFRLFHPLSLFLSRSSRRATFNLSLRTNHEPLRSRLQFT